MDKIDLFDDQRGFPDLPDLEKQDVILTQKTDLITSIRIPGNRDHHISVALISDNPRMASPEGRVPWI